MNLCTECRQPISGDNTRLTCSPKCRKRRERRQKDASTAWYLVLHEMQKIRDSIKRGEDVKKFRDQLIRIKDECNDLLLLANDEDQQQRRAMMEGWLKRRV